MSNIVILAGNLGADPDLKYTSAGKPILNLRVATTERWNDANGKPGERTDWHAVVLFGGKAEELARLPKGSRVYVEGSLQTRSWEKDGQKKFATEVVAKIIIGGGASERPEPRQQQGAPGRGASQGYGRSARPQEPAYGSEGSYGSSGSDDDIPF